MEAYLQSWEVETVEAAAAEVTGEGFLQISPVHPGDHKLAFDGVSVALTTVDDVIASRGWPEVSLIKVDVQGAEARVLAGAQKTIQRFRPALFVEVSDEGLRRFGSSSEALLKTCTAVGYAIRTFAGDALSRSLTVAEADAIANERGYVDFLLCEPTNTSHESVQGAGSRPL